MNVGGSKLKKELGTKELFAISAGAMISSGLFVLPAIVFARSGPSIILAYLLASVFVMPAMFSKAELATAMPKSGGVYFFVARSFGALFGVFTGFASWLSLSLKSSFALLGIGVFLVSFIPGISPNMIKVIAVGFTVVFTVLNLFTVKGAGRLQLLLVVFLLGSLTFFILGGIGRVDMNNFSPFVKGGFMELFTVTGLIFVSFGGLTKIASIAEEVKNPGKSIPRGMFLAFVTVTFLYILVVFVTVGVLPPLEFIETRTPISLAASKITGNIGSYILAIAAMAAFITTANAGLLAASRDPLAMSRDNLVPKAIAHVNKRFGTPTVSILLTAAFMIACIVFLDLESLVKVASTMKLLMFTFVNLAVIFMRESGVVSYKPVFKSPLYPYYQIAGVVVYIFLVIKMGILPLLISAGFFTLSFFVYLLYARKQVKNKSAFVHMVGNLTNRELLDGEEEQNEASLDGELLTILRERDEITEDRFDAIVRNALVLDFDETVSRDVFFRKISEAIAERWNVNPKVVESKFKERESQTSTLIYPGVAVPHAIPHIILDGKNVFDIVLVRNKFGIPWNDEGEVVYTAFCLIGSKDERNFHLKALMSIAQVLQDPDFHKQWTKARSANELRSVVLVAKRRRE